jgi:hypothetical protein
MWWSGIPTAYNRRKQHSGGLTMKSVLLSILAILLVIVVPVRAEDTAATATAPTQSAADAARALMLKQFRARGFKEKFRKGEIVWCRKEAPLGSRFEQSVCLTEVQMTDKLKNEAELQQELSRKGVCTGPECSGN